MSDRRPVLTAVLRGLRGARRRDGAAPAERPGAGRRPAIRRDPRARARTREHPFATTKANDNIVAFTTRRYAGTPLIVQGPGAGTEVTALGVFSDIFKLLQSQPH